MNFHFRTMVGMTANVEYNRSSGLENNDYRINLNIN